MTPVAPPLETPPSPPGETPSPLCQGTVKRGKRRGSPCPARVSPGSTYCVNHDPAREAERARAGAIRREPGDPGTELGTYQGIARRAAKVLEELETFSVVEDEDGDEHFVRHLEPAVANAKLNALRFLTVLIERRVLRKDGEPGDGPPSPMDLERALQ
jgi:hypothetical protein